jgi:hypothetical protein
MSKTKLPDELILKMVSEYQPLFGEHSIPTKLTAPQCPSCGSNATILIVDPQNPFRPGEVSPNRVGKCSSCNAVFNPATGSIRNVSI